MEKNKLMLLALVALALYLLTRNRASGAGVTFVPAQQPNQPVTVVGEALAQVEDWLTVPPEKVKTVALRAGEVFTIQPITIFGPGKEMRATVRSAVTVRLRGNYSGKNGLARYRMEDNGVFYPSAKTESILIHIDKTRVSVGI